MPFVPFPTTCQVETVCNFQGVIAESVYHVAQDTDWDAAGLASLCATFETWWKAEIQPLVSQYTVLSKIKARGLASSSDAGVELPVTSGGAGAHTTQPLPNNAALAVKWSTGLTGRSYRGRTYHFGMLLDQVNAVTSSSITSAFHTQVSDAYAALLTAVNIGDQRLVVASRMADSMPRTEGVSTNILSVSVDVAIDSQRRRLIGRGL